MSERDFSNDPFTLLSAATPTDDMSADECNALAKFQEIAKKIEAEREKINSLNSFLHSSQSQNVPQTIKDFSQSQIKESTELISNLSNQARELERSPILSQLVCRLSSKAHEEKLRQARIKIDEAAQEERKKIFEEYERKRAIAVASYKNTLNRKEQDSKDEHSGGYLNAAKSASYSDDNFSVISHNVDASATSERNEAMKIRLSIASIVSLFISTFALVLFGRLLDRGSTFPRLAIYWAWIILSVVSIVFPIFAKYCRNRRGAKGKTPEMIALILGAYDFHCVIIYAVKLNDYIALALIAVVCVIYAKSFNNCRKEQCDQVKPADERTRNIDANPASTLRTKAVPAAGSKRERKKTSFVLPFILVVLAVTTAISMVQYKNENSEVQITEQTTQPVPELVAKTPPAHGKLLKYPEKDAVAPLEIQTSGTGYYYFVLTILGDKDRPIMSFFAHAGKSVEVEVPFGKYDLYYAYGDTWYGAEDLFGDNTIREKCEDPLFFGYDGESYTGWTLTLYPVKDGNLDTVYVSEDEFP